MTIQKTKPILFSTEMVQAILAGRKTQTRRLVKEPMTADLLTYAASRGESLNDLVERYCKVKKGDILWVRETWVRLHEAYLQKLDPDPSSPHFFYWYKADGDPVHFEHYNESWKPSIHMPKEAARIFLKVTNVRVERLQDISENDAIGEGIAIDQQPMKNNDGWYYPKNYLPENTEYWGSRYFKIGEYSKSFKSLWDSINGKKYPWDTNPWVWVYTFEQTEKPDNFLNNETHHTTD